MCVYTLDPEALKFRDVEKRFVRQFNMPQEEKLVNCELVVNKKFGMCL